ncbi:response regulator [Flavobacterium nackdongense]|uniref:Response regulator n=1 Tax=Flavobacterium nackdongense TaxID=2547394 RepID=A0A4P6YDA4_9FLAO|nr:response regulator [Flavobacterium nackdongense]QBN18353.1 response regulator [Flavobacterium nackdongense]
MLETILFIDDDLITLMLCKMVISKASFSNEIATAKNGEEALSYFDKLKTTQANNKPQLIFLDLNMPVMNGWEFLDRFTTEIYSEFHNTKIVILSSTIDPADLERSKKYPMVLDFLSKPISKEMLEYLKDKI